MVKLFFMPVFVIYSIKSDRSFWWVFYINALIYCSIFCEWPFFHPKKHTTTNDSEIYHFIFNIISVFGIDVLASQFWLAKKAIEQEKYQLVILLWGANYQKITSLAQVKWYTMWKLFVSCGLHYELHVRWRAQLFVSAVV